MSAANASAPAPVSAPAPAVAESAIPQWMQLHNADGTWNPAGIFFWLVLLALLVVVLRSYGLLSLWATTKLTEGKAEDFYSDL